MSVYKLKACYKEGVNINGGVGNNKRLYLVDIIPSLNSISIASQNILEVRRVNDSGYGVNYNGKTALILKCEYHNGNSYYRVVESFTKKDISKHIFWADTDVKRYNAKVVGVSGNPIPPWAGGQSSNTLTIKLYSVDGFMLHYFADAVLDKIYELGISPEGIDSATVVSKNDYNNMYLSSDTIGSAIAKAAARRAAQIALWYCISECITQGVNYKTLTWYQLQYAVLQTEAPYYVDNDTAAAWIRQYDALAAVADEYL